MVAASSSATVRAARSGADGAAAAEAVRGKRARYRAHKNPACPLVPFVVESLGRVSDEALGLLRAVAPTSGPDRSLVLGSALQELSVLVQTRLAEQLSSAELGCQVSSRAASRRGA